MTKKFSFIKIGVVAMSFWKGLNIINKGISGNFIPMSAKTQKDMSPWCLCYLSLSLSLSNFYVLLNKEILFCFISLSSISYFYSSDFFSYFYLLIFPYNKCSVSVVIQTRFN